MANPISNMTNLRYVAGNVAEVFDTVFETEAEALTAMEELGWTVVDGGKICTGTTVVNEALTGGIETGTTVYTLEAVEGGYAVESAGAGISIGFGPLVGSVCAGIGIGLVAEDLAPEFWTRLSNEIFGTNVVPQSALEYFIPGIWSHTEERYYVAQNTVQKIIDVLTEYGYYNPEGFTEDIGAYPTGNQTTFTQTMGMNMTSLMLRAKSMYNNQASVKEDPVAKSMIYDMPNDSTSNTILNRAISRFRELNQGIEPNGLICQASGNAETNLYHFSVSAVYVPLNITLPVPSSDIVFDEGYYRIDNIEGVKIGRSYTAQYYADGDGNLIARGIFNDENPIPALIPFDLEKYALSNHAFSNSYTFEFHEPPNGIISISDYANIYDPSLTLEQNFPAWTNGIKSVAGIVNGILGVLPFVPLKIPDIDPYINPEKYPSTDPFKNPEVDPQPDTQTQPENDPLKRPWRNPFELPAPTPIPGPIPRPDPDPDPDPDPRPDPDPDPDPDPRPDPDPDPEPDPDPYPDPDPDPVPPIKPWDDPEPTPDPVRPTPDPVPPTPTPPIPPIPPIGGDANALFTVYNPTKTQLNSLGGVLWSNSIIDQIVQMFTNSPLDCIISLHILYATPSTGGNKNIKLGYIDTGIPAPEVTNQYVNISCGSVRVPERYGDAKDYSPFTTVHAFLPFIGIVQLKTEDVIGSVVGIDYKVDVFTGTVLCNITITKSNNVSQVLYTFDGNCAVQLPLTGADRSRQMASAVGTILGGIAGGLGGGITALGMSALSGGMKANIQRSGSFGSNAGAMGGKTPYLIINRSVPADANSYNTFYGFPANKTVTLSTCRGYTRVKDIHVENIPSATQNEKIEIENLLKDGVIIQ